MKARWITPSDAAAPARRLSRSSRAPRCTSAPAAASAVGRGVGAGEAEDLMAGADELGNDGGADEAGRAGDEYAHERPPWSAVTRCATDVSCCHHCSSDVSRCHRLRSSAWRDGSPDSRGRLEQAALELYGERGFENTTVAEIAKRGGADRANVLPALRRQARGPVRGRGRAAGAPRAARSPRAPESAAPIDAVARGPRGRRRASSRSAATAPGSARRSSPPTPSCTSAS